MSLAIVGDLSFGDHYAVASMGINTYRRKSPQLNLFRSVEEKLACSELIFGNLETVLSEAGLKRNNLQSMHMRGHPSDAQMIASAGFNILNIANNHILQHGVDAFLETVHLLTEQNIGIVGMARPNGRNCIPYFSQIDGQEVVFLGYAFEVDKYFHETTLYASGQEASIIDDIRRYKSKKNVVICSFHWGNEFVRYPSMDQVRLARRAVDAGCSLIIGHHPHVLNGYENWNDGLIFYSLGNFLFDQLWNNLCREGCLIKLELRNGKFSISESWLTEILPDFSIEIKEGEAEARCKFSQLNETLANACENCGKDYVRDFNLANKRNQLLSWLYLRNCFHYDFRILNQIVTDTLRRKLRVK